MGFYFEKPCLIDSFYLRWLLFISRDSVGESKTGWPDLAVQLVLMSFNPESLIFFLISKAHLPPGG